MVFAKMLSDDFFNFRDFLKNWFLTFLHFWSKVWVGIFAILVILIKMPVEQILKIQSFCKCYSDSFDQNLETLAGARGSDSDSFDQNPETLAGARGSDFQKIKNHFFNIFHFWHFLLLLRSSKTPDFATFSEPRINKLN